MEFMNGISENSKPQMYRRNTLDSQAYVWTATHYQQVAS